MDRIGDNGRKKANIKIDQTNLNILSVLQTNQP